MGISVIVLTQNSADTLEKTLASVSFCDEIIVIDDHSTDTSAEIAKEHGAIVYTRALGGDFSKQRNFGLSKATCEWVLFVDSDEVVSSELREEIAQAIQSVDVNGFFLRRQDILWGRELLHGETEKVRLLRLARAGKGKWQRPVHEVWDVTGAVGTLTHALHHTPHPSVSHFLADINTYSTINAQYFFEQKTRVSVFHIVAYPTAKFIQNYIVHQGFLDGMPGMVVALMMSFHSFLTRAKLWQLYQKRG
jgi:glycosyltransferase involved in cell wall biosynthesis